MHSHENTRLLHIVYIVYIVHDKRRIGICA